MTVEGEGVIGASCGAVVVGDGDGAKGNMTIDDYARAWYVRCYINIYMCVYVVYVAYIICVACSPHSTGGNPSGSKFRAVQCYGPLVVRMS